MADRCYCPGPWVDGVAVLEGDEARHLARVRRVGPGEIVEVFDGEGRSATAEVASVSRECVTLRIRHASTLAPSIPNAVVLASAVPKGERFDWLVEKATELGVTRLVPLITSRSTVDPRSAKLDRLRRLIIEASKQSGRNRLMTLDEPTTWGDWLRADSSVTATKLVAHPTGRPLSDGPAIDLAAGLAIAIGPEGGFTDIEVSEAVQAGYQSISLGPTILRIETAAIASCAWAVAAHWNPNKADEKGSHQ